MSRREQDDFETQRTVEALTSAGRADVLSAEARDRLQAALAVRLGSPGTPGGTEGALSSSTPPASASMSAGAGGTPLALKLGGGLVAAMFAVGMGMWAGHARRTRRRVGARSAGSAFASAPEPEE